MEVLNRITLNPEVCNGRPTVRNQQLTVSQILELLAGGKSTDELLSQFPFLEAEDIQACLMYAARMANF
ncbi:MAG: DUF433 domain-containing protein [Bacteroidota bacterium]